MPKIYKNLVNSWITGSKQFNQFNSGSTSDFYAHITVLLVPESQCTTQYVEKCYSRFQKCNEVNEDAATSCIRQDCHQEQEEIWKGEK